VFEIGKIDNIESRLVRRLEDDGRRADGWPQWLNRASSGPSQVGDHVHGLIVYIAHPAIRDQSGENFYQYAEYHFRSMRAD
jgi:hypothetical protein